MAQFSKREAIRFGWQTTKKHLRFLLGVMLVVGVVYVMPGLFQEPVKALPLLSLLIGLSFLFLEMVMDLGLIKISLKLHDHKSAKLRDLFIAYPLLFKYLAASILYGFIVVYGFVFFIIPGIIFMIKLQYYSYLIVDKGVGPIEALKRSWAITRGVKWNLFLFGLLLTSLLFLGALAFIVGLLIAAPVALVSNAFVYRRLSSHHAKATS